MWKRINNYENFPPAASHYSGRSKFPTMLIHGDKNWQKMSLQSNTGLTSLIVRNGACPYWVIDMFTRLFVSMPFATKHCKETPAIPKLRENYFQPAAGENFWGGAGVSRPDLWKINYLGQIRNSASQSITWAVPSECTTTVVVYSRLSNKGWKYFQSNSHLFANKL